MYLNFYKVGGYERISQKEIVMLLYFFFVVTSDYIIKKEFDAFVFEI